MDEVLFEKQNHSRVLDVKFFIHQVKELQFVFFECQKLIVYVRVIGFHCKVDIKVSELLDFDLHLVPWVTDHLLVGRDYFLLDVGIFLMALFCSLFVVRFFISWLWSLGNSSFFDFLNEESHWIFLLKLLLL